MKTNSRPLVGVSDDPRDNSLLMITPFHLRMAKPVAVFPSCIDNLSASDLDKIKLSIQDRFQKWYLIFDPSMPIELTSSSKEATVQFLRISSCPSVF